MGQTCMCQLSTQKGCPDTQNQRIRPYFLGQKCRSRYSASIGPVHVPKLGLRPPTNPEKGVERGIMNDFILFFVCFLIKPIIWRDVFLEIHCFMVRTVKISEICPDWNIARGQMWFHFLTQKDRSDKKKSKIQTNERRILVLLVLLYLSGPSVSAETEKKKKTSFAC